MTRAEGNLAQDLEEASSQAAATDQAAEFAELWRPEEAPRSQRGPERVLLEKGQITPQQFEAAIGAQRENPSLSVLETLVRSGACDEIVALQAVAEYFRLPFARLNASEIDPEVVSALPMNYLREKLVIPITRDGEAFVVGMADPADIFLIDDIKRRLKAPVKLTVVPGEEIAKAIEELSTGPGQQVDEIIKGIAEDTVEVVDSRDDEVADL